MQATSIVTLPVSTSSIDTAAETPYSGQGIRVSAAHGSKARNSLFTAILQQGFTLSSAASLAADNEAGQENPEDGIQENGGEAVDVCGLLMLLAVPGAPAQDSTDVGNTGTDDVAPTGVQSAILSNPGLAGPSATEDMTLQGEYMTTAAALQNDTTTGAAELPDAGGQTAVPADGVRSATVFAAIKAALQKETNPAVQSDSALAQVQAAVNESMVVNESTAVNVSAAVNESAAAVESTRNEAAGINLAQAVTAEPAAGLPEAKSGSADTVNTAAGTAGVQDIAAGSVKPAAPSNNGSDASGGSFERSPRDRSGLEDVATAGTNAALTAAGTLTAEAAAAEIATAGTTAAEAAAAETAAAVEKALNRFSEDLRSLRGGTHEIRIVLEPESLGVLTISVVKTETGVSAKIKSEDKEVVAAISNQLQKLFSTMESKGIHLDDVDVVHSQAEGGGNGSQHSAAQDGAPPRGRSASPGRDQGGEAQDDDMFKGYYGGMTGSESTVDYTV
jgi:flagellar hook-length control protein FliK